MPKTPIKKRFKKHLAIINDQLCYYLFADKEVENKLFNIEEYQDDKYTTQLFAENEFSPKLRVKFSNLSKFRSDVSNANKALSLVLGTEYLLEFIKEVERFRENIVSHDDNNVLMDSAEDQLLNKLIKWNLDKIERCIFKTVKYLRLRRNHIIHARAELSDELKKIIKQESWELNIYWKKKRTKLKGVDFSKLEVDAFTTEESLSLMNLIRVCIEEIDLMVISSINTLDLINYEIRLIEIPTIVGIKTLDKYANKLTSKIRNKYMIDVQINEVEELLNSYLMKK